MEVSCQNCINISHLESHFHARLQFTKDPLIWNRPCHNVKELHCVGLHWRVPLLKVLSETVQVVW